MASYSAPLPIGQSLPDWRVPELPPRVAIEGCYCRLLPLSASRHATMLWQAFSDDEAGLTWTYLPYGPFLSELELRAGVEKFEHASDSINYAIQDRESELILGWAGFLRLLPENGSIEIGNLTFAPAMRRTRVATETIFLMVDLVFQLGYRRCEWKCDSLNAASVKAAQRFGFVEEGTFRQDRVYKGRSRDTRWFSIIDGEWPRLRKAYQLWLDAKNFEGQAQRQRLEAFLISPYKNS